MLTFRLQFFKLQKVDGFYIPPELRLHEIGALSTWSTLAANVKDKLHHNEPRCVPREDSDETSFFNTHLFQWVCSSIGVPVPSFIFIVFFFRWWVGFGSGARVPTVHHWSVCFRITEFVEFNI